MAAKNSQVGSAAWISAEKENVRQLLKEEKEELVFPAQHEIEWLNEHMEEIFSKRHVNMTNVFKTPGKMKGKTPRTNRRPRVGDSRMPLGDVFTSQSTKKQSKSPMRPLGQRPPPPPPKFEIAKDRPELPQRQLPSQTDSGYQGSSQSPSEAGEPPAVPPRSPLRPAGQTPQNVARPRQERERTTDGSFHSAKEVGPQDNSKLEAQEQEQQEQEEQQQEQEAPPPQPTHQAQSTKQSARESVDLDMDDIGSPSDESTPDRPLVRKGSLTFASLPAREPLKTSMGARISRTSHSIHQNLQPRPGSLLQMHEDRQPHDAENDNAHGDDDVDDDDDDDIAIDDSHIVTHARDESEDESQPIRLPNKTTAQRLHDKLEQLGKAPARTSKSIPSFMATANKSSAAPPILHHPSGPTSADDEDDWIKPLPSPGKQVAKAIADEAAGGQDEFDVRAPELIAHEERMKTPEPSPSPRPGFGHTKSFSTATLASPAKAAMVPPSPGSKSISVSNPGAKTTTTPQESPRRYLDLSASKQRLHSIMKTAKNLFTNSAGVSAAAKQEVLSPCAVKSTPNMMPGLFPQTSLMLDKPLPAIAPEEGRSMRSSTEREREDKRRQKETKAMQKMNDDLEKARQKEAQKAAAANAQKSAEAEPVETQRVTRTARVGAGHAAKARPAPVAIKVGMQRIAPGSSSIANPKQDTLPAEPRRPRLNKKASITSISSQSTTNLKTSVHPQVAKPKALLAAERKKLQDEQEAARKLEQKREMERRRQAQQEEKRAEEERRERERVIAEQAKRQAQQQAIEKKRQEAARKAEQQRLERERAAAAEASRPASRLGSQQPTVGRSLINHPIPTNPAKPPKRPIEEESSRAQAPKYGAASQQQDSKRRKTDEEEQGHRPTISGAPIRQSNLSKKPSIFNHAVYTAAAPAQASQITQFPQPPTRAQPPQMSQFAHQKIPFADAPTTNPSTQPSQAKVQPPPPPPPMTTTSSSSSIRQVRTIQAVKSSPQYPHGEQISLPEIPTDSEEEDSDDEASNHNNAFSIPDWATPGHLSEQLMRQEAMDGDSVFGPIAPLKMEEIFAKGNKERLRRLRDRTSSANWTMSGDGLTLEEVRADREQRERMRLEGGWHYRIGS